MRFFLRILCLSFLPALPASAASAWTVHPLDTDFDLNGVVWTGSQLVAVGGSFSGENVVYTSKDGAAWDRRPVAGTTQDGLNAVCWTGTQLVAVGPNGNVLTSPDGIGWTQRLNSWPEAWVGVAWTGSLLIAVTGLGTILTSPDGIDWTIRLGGDAGPRTYFNSVAWAHGQAVALGGTGWKVADGSVHTSPDGMTWTKHTLERAPGLRSAAWTGKQWTAVGGIFDGNGDKVVSRLGATSSDGNAWTVASDSAEEILESVAWAGSGLVAVGWDGVRMFSADGAAWTRTAADTLPRLQAVAWTGSLAVAVGWGSTIVTMPMEPAVSIAPPARSLPAPRSGRTGLYTPSGRRIPEAGARVSNALIIAR
ncbi:MAG TPA: hypothetical protein VJ385_15610 [Fibrobacteria bacterium]|nr:hypothetical protein [Fibrobacteria bacterium]